MNHRERDMTPEQKHAHRRHARRFIEVVEGWKLDRDSQVGRHTVALLEHPSLDNVRWDEHGRLVIVNPNTPASVRVVRR